MIKYHRLSDVGEKSMLAENFLNVGEITNIRVNTYSSTYIFNNIFHQHKNSNYHQQSKLGFQNAMLPTLFKPYDFFLNKFSKGT